MLILAQCLQLENSKDNICLVQVPELEKQYLDAGYQRCERSYKIKYQRKEYTVICLEFRDDKNSAEPIVIIPEFLIPGRSYPVFVYLYAIALYSGSPEKGQRWAAEETRKYFGLDTFAHTTLGRALKVFVRNIEEATKASDNIHNETSSNDKEKNEIQNSNAGQSDTHTHDQRNEARTLAAAATDSSDPGHRMHRSANTARRVRRPPPLRLLPHRA